MPSYSDHESSEQEFFQESVNFSLNAISPLDGRYKSSVSELSSYFSEQSLIKYRVRVEVEYFLALTKIHLSSLKNLHLRVDQTLSLKNLYQKFGTKEAIQIKKIEATTNHDVKAVEYYLKEQFTLLGLEDYKEFIHFGLTSQDINNTAIPLLFKESMETVLLPMLEVLLAEIKDMAHRWREIPMLAYTHGQVASPTRLGKEFLVFVERLEGQFAILKQLPHSAKFGGATGNFNAHKVAYPEIDWKTFADRFIHETFGLVRSQYTTQIDNYDHLGAYLDTLKRINSILIDFSRDLWQYISMQYFMQKIVKGQIGSSTMPHKVNPIDFENAEGNLGLANALFEHLSAKLPISRLQRDLTDSTVLRNLGVPSGHSLLAYKSLMKGLQKLVLNPGKIEDDLNHNWVVVAEAIQTILRREGVSNPYEKLKELTRNHENIDQNAIHNFIDSLQISDSIKEELKQITPFNYVGI